MATSVAESEIQAFYDFLGRRVSAGAAINPEESVRQLLQDGTEVEVIWSWLSPSRRAKLVTVYFRD